MNLPDFLKEMNQGAEKAFGENEKSMIDSLLYANLPPKLKRSVNMARLENGTYEEIVAHLERELELNALEESDDLPMATMASVSTGNSNLLSNGINKDAQCFFCKATRHYYRSCPKLKRRRNWRTKMAKSPNVQHTQNAPHARKRITPLSGAGKELGHTYVPRGHDLKTRRTNSLVTKNIKEVI